MTRSTELAWAAGFLDGEGSISVVQYPGRYSWYPLAQVGNKERKPVERFREIVGTGFMFKRRQDGFYMGVRHEGKLKRSCSKSPPTSLTSVNRPSWLWRLENSIRKAILESTYRR